MSFDDRYANYDQDERLAEQPETSTTTHSDDSDPEYTDQFDYYARYRRHLDLPEGYFDDEKLLELNSDVVDMINTGEYDAAEELVSKRLEQDPINSVLYKLFFRIQDLRQSIPGFPGDSVATKRLKERFLGLIKTSSIALSHPDQLKYTEMIFNKFFFFIEYPDETILDTLIEEIPEFNLFKNN
jgi:hypothetical protein